MRIRDKLGKFINKSESYRKTRSIRVSDEIWEKFGNIANQMNVTRADLLEQMINDDCFLSRTDKKLFLLEEALKLTSKLRSDSSKLIRKKILEYLETKNK